MALVADGVYGEHDGAPISAWRPHPDMIDDLGAPELELVCREGGRGISGTQFQAENPKPVIAWLTHQGITAERSQFGPGLTVVKFGAGGAPVTVRFGHTAFELIQKSFASQQ